LSIVPLNITVDSQTYRDFEDITSTQLLTMIEDHKIPKTSQPSLGEKIDLYNELSKDGDEVIDIVMASGLSGTYQTAMMAKNSCDNPDLVHVVDTQTLCGPHRLMVDTALEMANNGASAKDIVKMIVQSRMQEESYLVPVDFQFLVRGGRIKGLAATLGGALKLIPILKKGVDGMGLDKFGVSRTYKKAVNMVVEDFKNNGFDSNYTFYISHAFNEDLAMMFEKKIKETFEGVKVVIYPLSAAFITQGGPGCVAVQAIKMA
jgi:DegV family protein with EDD domain